MERRDHVPIQAAPKPLRTEGGGLDQLLVAGLAAWLWTADLGLLKPQIERFVTKQTGREFRIAGEL